MNQLAMIGQTCDSTGASTRGTGAECVSDANLDCRDKFSGENEDDNTIFQNLKTSELLKHLLNARIEDESNTSVNGSNDRMHESCNKRKSQLPSVNPQPTKLRTYCNAASYESINKIGNPSKDCVITRSASVPVSYEFFAGHISDENGIMDKRLFNKSDISETSSIDSIEVQNEREQLERYFSNDSSQSNDQHELFEDDDFPILPQELLINETMEFILSEAQKTLHIESPPSSHDSDSCEFTELLPKRQISTESSTVEVSAGPSTSGLENAIKSPSTSEISETGKQNKSDTDSDTDDSDIDNSMVLVPSDPLEWTNTHIASWLAWCSRKFSIQPKPDLDLFPATGSELCDLSRSEFEKCAGSERTGTILAKHIAHLRHSVTGRASSPLNVECKAFEEENEDDDERDEYRQR